MARIPVELMPRGIPQVAEADGNESHERMAEQQADQPCLRREVVPEAEVSDLSDLIKELGIDSVISHYASSLPPRSPPVSGRGSCELEFHARKVLLPVLHLDHKFALPPPAPS